jgi:hypothetical protein
MPRKRASCRAILPLRHRQLEGPNRFQNCIQAVIAFRLDSVLGGVEEPVQLGFPAPAVRLAEYVLEQQ